MNRTAPGELTKTNWRVRVYLTGAVIILATLTGVGPNPAAAGVRGAGEAGCVTSSADLKAVADLVHESQRNVGLAAVVWRAGKLPLAYYSGFADLEHQVEVDSETVFGIASVTKLFTAVALLRLVAAGEVDLDAAVQNYLPQFPVKPEGTITLRHLATHRSGLPHPQERTPELFATHYETAREALELFAEESLVAPPGEKRIYSSSNYNLLAAVIEAVRGQAFGEVLQREIFRPASLSDTRLDDVIEVIPHRSRRYSYYHPWSYVEADRLYRVPTWDYSFNIGGGNLLSTAPDLMRFGAALLEPGLLPADELRILFDEAWFGEADESAGRSIFVTGSNPGVQAGLSIFPEYEIVGRFALTAGLFERSLESLRRAAHLGSADEPEIERKIAWVEERLRAEWSPVTLPLQRKRSLTGVYGPLEVRLEQNALIAQREGGEPHDLLALSDHSFALADNPLMRLSISDEDGDGQPDMLDIETFDGGIVSSVRKRE